MSPSADVSWLAALAELTCARNEFGRQHGYDATDSVPNPPASADALAAVERHLGEPLDFHHRRLLAATDGWPDGLDGADLFGTDDLLGRTNRLTAAIDDVGAFNSCNSDGTFLAP